jgi:flagellar biosynthesis chaperone FliJ
MKRPGPLARLLRLREIREEQSRAALGLATRTVSRAEGALEAAAEAHASRPGFPELPSPAALRGLILQGVRTQELLASAADAYGEALGRAGQARLDWSAASAELRTVEKLEQRRRLEAERLAQTAADRALDEMVLTIRNLRR